MTAFAKFSALTITYYWILNFSHFYLASGDRPSCAADAQSNSNVFSDEGDVGYPRDVCVKLGKNIYDNLNRAVSRELCDNLALNKVMNAALAMFKNFNESVRTVASIANDKQKSIFECIEDSIDRLIKSNAAGKESEIITEMKNLKQSFCADYLRQLQQEEKRQRAAEAATRRLTEQPDAHERESVAGVLGPAEQSSIGEGESVDLARGHTEQQDTHERESEGVVLGLAEEPSTGEEKSAAEARRLAASQSINEIQLEALVDSQNGADNVIPTDDGIDQSNIPIEDMTDILRAAREEPGDEEYAKDLAARERAAIEAGREHLGQNGETVNGGIENFETQELATAENWGTVETAAMGGAAQGTAAGEESMRERAARAAAERAAQAAIQGATAPPAPTPQTAPQTSAAGEAAVRAATARAAAARVAAAGTVDAQAAGTAPQSQSFDVKEWTDSVSTDEDYETAVYKKYPVIVFFYSKISNNQNTNTMLSRIEKIIHEKKGAVRLVKATVEELTNTYVSLEISSVPCTMIYLRGTDRFRFKTAVEDEETIRTELNKVLSAAVAEKDKPFSGQP